MAALMRMSRRVNSSVLGRLLHTNTSITFQLANRTTSGVTVLQNDRITPRFIARHLCTPSSDDNMVAMDTASGSRQTTTWPLSARLDFIQDQLARKSMIDKKQLLSLLSYAKEEGQLTVREAMFILRCSGSCLMKQTAPERQQLFSHVLNFIQARMEPATIAFHNVLLMVRLENEDYFDPVEILAEIESQGLAANRITYQVMINAYCLRGDVDGATKILAHMRELNISVTEHVFHSLIVGYMKQGDVENAKGVLSMMREANLLPVAETYMVLLCGLAVQGDYGKLNQVLSEAESEDVMLFAKHLLPVLIQLAKHNHLAQFDELLEYIATRYQNRAPYNIVAMNCVYQLGMLGLDEQAREVYDSIVQFYSPEHRNRFATIFIESLVIQNKPYEMISSTYKSLHQEGALQSRDSDKLITELASKHRNRDLAMSGRSNMMESGSSLSVADIRTIINQKETSGDIDGIYEFINQTYRNSNLYSDMSGLVYQFTQKAFSNLSISPEDVKNTMKEKGFSDRLILQYNIRDLLSQGHLKEAALLYHDVRSYEQVSLTRDVLQQGLINSQFDTVHFFKLLRMCRKHMSPDNRFVNIFTSVISGIMETDITGEQAVELFKGYMTNKVPIRSVDVLRNIKQKLVEKGVEESESETLHKQMIDEVQVYVSANERSNITGKSMQSLLETVAKDPESLPQKLVNFAENVMLRKHMRNKRTEEAVALRTKLEERGCYFGLQDLKEIVLFELEQRKNVECAKKYLKKIEDETFRSDRHMVISIATTLVETGQYQDALEELRGHTLPPTLEDDNDLLHLLKAVCVTGDSGLLREMKGLLVEREYMPQDGQMYWHCTIQEVLHSKSSDDILQVCNEAYTSISSIPDPVGVLEHFVKQEDLENMQKVVDLLTSSSSEDQVLHQIVLAFINCNKPRQALKVLQTPNLRFGKETIEEMCKTMYLAQRFDSMDQYVKLTKGLVRSYDRDSILFWLIKFHVNMTNDIRRAVDVLTMYEEEGLSPSPRTKRYLSNVLRSKGLDIPVDLADIPPRNRKFEQRREPRADDRIREKTKTFDSELKVDVESVTEAEGKSASDTSRMTETM